MTGFTTIITKWFGKMKINFLNASKQYLITTELNLKYSRASSEESPSTTQVAGHLVGGCDDSFQFRPL